MPRDNLSEFLEALASTGDLARVTAQVDPDQEIAEITRRVAERDGPALLFERVRERDYAVVSNLFASRERVCRALEADSYDEFVDRLERAGENGGGRSWLDRLRSRTVSPALERFLPKSAKVGACQQVVRLGRDVDLGLLPALRSWADEAAPTLTSGRLLFAAADAPPGLIGRPLLPVLDRSRLAVAWQGYDAAGRHFRQLGLQGEKFPLAVVLGGDPLWLLLGELACLRPLDLAALTGLLRQRPMELVAGRTQNVQVPAEAELVLEGYVNPQEPPVDCGQVAVHGGVYHQPRGCRVMHVTAVTQRTNAASPVDVVGPPAGRSSAVDRLHERLLLPMLQAVVPEAVDLALPCLGGGHSFAVVALRQEHPGAARRAAGAVWAMGPLMLTKTVIVVDDHVDVRSLEEVMARVGAHVSPQRDVFFHQGPADPFDPATADPMAAAGKLGVDATAKPDLSRTDGQAGLPTPAAAIEVALSKAIQTQVEERWPQYGIAARPPSP